MQKLKPIYFTADKNNIKLFIALIFALILIGISTLVSDDGSIQVSTIPEESFSDNDVDIEPNLAFTYEESLEHRLETALSNVYGAGEVDVLITLEENSSKVLAKNNDTKTKTTNETNGEKQYTVLDEESQEEVIYSGDNNNQPYIIGETKPDIAGVLIITTGADDIYIVDSFTKVAENLLDVPSYKISVLKMK